MRVRLGLGKLDADKVVIEDVFLGSFENLLVLCIGVWWLWIGHCEINYIVYNYSNNLSFAVYCPS